MFTAYSVIAARLGVDHRLDGVAHVRRAVALLVRLGEERRLDVRVGDPHQVARCRVDHDVRVRVDGEERRQRGDARLDLPVDERAAVRGERVVEEEVEATEVLERERELVDRVGDRDADLAAVGVDGAVTAARRVVELRLRGARDDVLGGVQAAVDGSDRRWSSCRTRDPGARPALTWAIGCCPTRTCGLPSPATDVHRYGGDAVSMGEVQRRVHERGVGNIPLGDLPRTEHHLGVAAARSRFAYRSTVIVEYV